MNDELLDDDEDDDESDICEEIGMFWGAEEGGWCR